MTEDEWFQRGDEALERWSLAAGLLTSYVEQAFEYAWELAGREAGIIK